jgi:hypothetical protein
LAPPGLEIAEVAADPIGIINCEGSDPNAVIAEARSANDRLAAAEHVATHDLHKLEQKMS